MEPENDPIATLLQLAGRRPRRRPRSPRAFARACARNGRAARDAARRRAGWPRPHVWPWWSRLRWSRCARRSPLRRPCPRAVVAHAETISGAAVGSGGRFLEPGAELRAGDTMETARGATASLLWGGATLRIDGSTSASRRVLTPAFARPRRGVHRLERRGRRGGHAPRRHRRRRHAVRSETRRRAPCASACARAVSTCDATARRIPPRRASSSMAGAQGEVTRRAVPRSGAEWDWVLRAAPAVTLEGRTLARRRRCREPRERPRAGLRGARQRRAPARQRAALARRRAGRRACGLGNSARVGRRPPDRAGEAMSRRWFGVALLLIAATAQARYAGRPLDRCAARSRSRKGCASSTATTSCGRR